MEAEAAGRLLLALSMLASLSCVAVAFVLRLGLMRGAPVLPDSGWLMFEGTCQALWILALVTEPASGMVLFVAGLSLLLLVHLSLCVDKASRAQVDERR